MELLHALDTNVTKAAVPQVCGTIVINFISFGIHAMNMCNTMFEIH